MNTAPTAPVEAPTAPAGAAPAENKPADGNDTQTS
jgi:hypothetical protein